MIIRFKENRQQFYKKSFLSPTLPLSTSDLEKEALPFEDNIFIWLGRKHTSTSVTHQVKRQKSRRKKQVHRKLWQDCLRLEPLWIQNKLVGNYRIHTVREEGQLKSKTQQPRNHLSISLPYHKSPRPESFKARSRISDTLNITSTWSIEGWKRKFPE